MTCRMFATFRGTVPAFTLFALTGLASAQTEIPLWPGGAPGSEGKTAKEVVNGSQVSSIHFPSITPYLPAKEKATGAAVIIAPGGGHRFLSINNEGYDVAKWLSERGIAGIVLKYRLAREEGSTYQVDVHALADAQRAIRLVRSRAREWNVNPAAVGIMGFSAGGEVAALAGTRFDAGKATAADPIDRVNARPDFMALIYPGIRPDNITVTAETPPTFLLCAFDDNGPARSIATLFLKLKEAKVPAELHIFNAGGHGFGMRNRPLPVSSWPMRFQEWLGDLKMLEKK